MPRKYLNSKNVIFISLILLIMLMALFVLKGNNYILTSMLFALVSCFPFFYKYEERKPEAKEFIVIAIMIALAVVSRLLFAFIPVINPIISIIIITGASFGRQSGFMCGSLSAIISNMFFGQGPWSLYQMLLWGLIGYTAGVLNQRGFIDNKVTRMIFAILCGVLFSIFIDFLSALGTGYTMSKFFALVLMSIPFMVYYAIGNMLFLFFLYDPIIKKLKRVKYKYGLDQIT